MAKVTVRVRCAAGQGVVRGLSSEDSLEKLISHALEALGRPETKNPTKLLTGFPPRPLDLTDLDRSLASAGVQSGDTIILQLDQDQGAAEGQAAQTSTISTGPVFGPQSKQSGSSKHAQSGTQDRPVSPKRQKREPELLKRQVVPADNSCLFTSINFCMAGQLVSSEDSAFMREVIASVVSSDPAKYCEAFLGRTNPAYCTWIQTRDAWGGAIEVQILSEYFQVEIVVVDTKSGSLTVFGESLGLPSRMVLIYDGIHYDPLYSTGPAGQKVTVHPVSDATLLERARLTAEKARAQHNYTDTAGFTLKCLVCGHRMKGQTEAQAHAKATTHTNFSEV